MKKHKHNLPVWHAKFQMNYLLNMFFCLLLQNHNVARKCSRSKKKEEYTGKILLKLEAVKGSSFNFNKIIARFDDTRGKTGEKTTKSFWKIEKAILVLLHKRRKSQNSSCLIQSTLLGNPNLLVSAFKF